MSGNQPQQDNGSMDPATRDELFTLLGGLCDDTINDQQRARLGELMVDAEARSIYRRYINLHGTVRAYHAHAVDVDFEHFDSIESIASGHNTVDEHAPENIAAMNTMSRINAWLNGKPVEGTDGDGKTGASAGRTRWSLVAKAAAIVLSTAAVLVIAINLMQPTTVPPMPIAVLTDSHHAQWVDDQNRLVFNKSGKVLLPQTLRLTDGLAEIKFNDGAVVLLDARERAVTFTLKTEAEAFLQLGKLTARAESETAKGFTVAVPGNQKVIDISTAFGIVVDETGRSEVHVIEGAVDVAQIAEDGSTKTVRMSEGQAVELDQSQNAIETIEEAKEQFLAMLPAKPARSNHSQTGSPDGADKVVGPFNTGIELRVGQADPNWRIIAAKNLPGFQAQQAVVCVPLGNFRPNDPLTSQWLSNGANLPAVPGDAVLTFQTKFTLPKAGLKSRQLRVRYIADNVLVGVRLNGRAVNVSSKTELKSFVEFSTFNVNDGFKDGENVLELDIGNASLGQGRANPLAYCVEFEWVGE